MYNIKMIQVNADTFKMGGGDIKYRPDALPVHVVNITNDFCIAEEPIKYDLYERFYTEKYNESPDVENYKGFVVGISWYEADEFCRWLSEKTGVLYRLPIEAEWEYCARNSKELGIDRMCDLNM